MRGLVQRQTLLVHRWTEQDDVLALYCLTMERIVFGDDTGIVNGDEMSTQRFGYERAHVRRTMPTTNGDRGRPISIIGDDIDGQRAVRIVERMVEKHLGR